MKLSTWASGLPLGLTVLLTALLTACQGSNDDSSAAADAPRVGLMHVGTDHVPPSWPSLKARLAELGWTHGRDIQLMWRNLEPDAAEAQADVFVGQRVDVIVAFEDTRSE